MNVRGSLGAMSAGVIGAALLLTACSEPDPEPHPVPAAVECTEASTAGVPGDAELIFTHGGSMGGWSLYGPTHFTVVYADGTVAEWEDTPAAAFPPAGTRLAPFAPETPGAFRAGHLNPCATEEFLGMLAEVFDDPDRDFGAPRVTDAVSLTTEYRAPGAEETMQYRIYAPGFEYDDDGGTPPDLTPAQRQARFDVRALRDFLDVNTAEGDLLRPDTLEVHLMPGGGSLAPEQWPIEDLAQIEVSSTCGALTGEDAQEVLDLILTGRGGTHDFSVLALPPGMSPCQG